MLKNCGFYIVPLYKFLHSLGSEAVLAGLLAMSAPVPKAHRITPSANPPDALPELTCCATSIVSGDLVQRGFIYQSIGRPRSNGR